MSGIIEVELARGTRRRPDVPRVLATGYSEALAQEGGQGFDPLREPYLFEARS